MSRERKLRLGRAVTSFSMYHHPCEIMATQLHKSKSSTNLFFTDTFAFSNQYITICFPTMSYEIEVITAVNAVRYELSDVVLHDSDLVIHSNLVQSFCYVVWLLPLEILSHCMNES